MEQMSSTLAEDPSRVQDRLSGAQQVAALLLSIDPTRAARLLKRFDSAELRQITRAVAHLGELQTGAVEPLMEEFFASFSVGTGLQGSAEKAKTLLTEAFSPDQVAEVLSDAIGTEVGDLWLAITRLPVNALIQYLENEHPQAVIYILSKLDSAFVSKIVPSLPRDMRNQALARMISPLTLSQEAERVIENALRDDLLGAANSSIGSDCAKVANIINNLEPRDFEQVLSEIKQAYPDEARLISKMIFSFDDLPRLSRRSLTIVFDKVPAEVVVLALRGTEAQFRDVVLSTMASRSRRLVESELSSPTAALPRDVAKARKDIAALVLSLAQRNEIELPSSDDPESNEGRESQ
jgi:flagellar motor switch protein FliG